MKIVPAFVLEDRDGNAPGWLSEPLDGISLFPTERVLMSFDKALEFIFRHDHENDGFIHLRGGYVFYGLDDRVLFAHHELSVHLVWDAAFNELNTNSSLEWQDFGGGGFRYTMKKENGTIRICHSRGGFAVFEGSSFFELTREAVKKMGTFKKVLEQGLLKSGGNKVDAAQLHQSLWVTPT